MNKPYESPREARSGLAPRVVSPDRIPPWLLLLQRRQFEVNCLASVSIEVPALRHAFRAAVAALDGENVSASDSVSSSDAASSAEGER